MTYLMVSNDPLSLEQDAINFSKSYNPSDVFWIKRAPDKKEITVDVVNDLIEQVNLVAVSGKKLFLIFEAELLNVSAQNKILKTIESTDDNTTFIFLCKNLNKILPTIRSRSIIQYRQFADNLTLEQMEANNPESAQIKILAEKLLQASTVDQALTYLPTLSKTENQTLALNALSHFTKISDFAVEKKLAIYQTLATISRNIEVNCNPINTFDLLLLTLF